MVVAGGRRRSGYDWALLAPVLCLLALGLAVAYSASSHTAAHHPGDRFTYLERQALFCLLGCGLMVAAKNIPCTVYPRLAHPSLLVAILVWLLSLFFPGFDHGRVGGGWWLRWPGFPFPLSDFAKFIVLVYLASLLGEERSRSRSFSKRLLARLLVAGTFTSLLVAHGAPGTALVLATLILILLIVSGINRRWLFSFSILSAGAAVLWLRIVRPYTWMRLRAFINPWDEPTHQCYCCLKIDFVSSLRSGGVFGVGLGRGEQDLFGLAEAYTDLVLPVVAEELGLLGLIAVLAMFTVLITRGIQVARDAGDLYGNCLALGVTFLIGLPAIVSLAVATGSSPVFGVFVPLVSYGGPSVMVTLFYAGILHHISSRRGDQVLIRDAPQARGVG